MPRQRTMPPAPAPSKGKKTQGNATQPITLQPTPSPIQSSRTPPKASNPYQKYEVILFVVDRRFICSELCFVMLSHRYTVVQVGAWLESVGLGQLKAEFEEQQIDGETLVATDLQGERATEHLSMSLFILISVPFSVRP
jgi:hypothetical protein